MSTTANRNTIILYSPALAREIRARYRSSGKDKKRARGGRRAACSHSTAMSAAILLAQLRFHLDGLNVHEYFSSAARWAEELALSKAVVEDRVALLAHVGLVTVESKAPPGRRDLREVMHLRLTSRGRELVAHHLRCQRVG